VDVRRRGTASGRRRRSASSQPCSVGEGAGAGVARLRRHVLRCRRRSAATVGRIEAG
jgi:hypothetical protein